MSSELPADPFVAAICSGDLTQAQSLIASVDINAPLAAADDAPPLHLAVIKRQTGMVELLLQSGARVDERDKNDRTACHYAVESGEVAVLSMLIAQGANLSLNDHDGRSPLALAITRNNERIVITLIEAGAPLDDSAAVCRAAAIGVNAASALIKRNINLNELRDADGNNPCHYAAKGTDVQVLKALVAHGVDIDALDKNDKHCVHKAASSGRLETLRWLIDSAVDVNVEDCTGQTALMHACMGGHVPCALLLISAGADVCAVDSEAHTVLHFAEHCCLSRPLRHALVAAGADMDVRDDYDRSPRDIAGRMSAIEHSNRGLNGLPPFVALMMMMATFKPAELISESELNLARRETENMRRQFVRERALQVCMGLQSLRINALQMCEILVHACGPVAQLLSFGWWWKVATTVKHFHKK